MEKSEWKLEGIFAFETFSTQNFLRRKVYGNKKKKKDLIRVGNLTPCAT